MRERGEKFDDIAKAFGVSKQRVMMICKGNAPERNLIAKLRTGIIEKMGGKCVRCGFDDPRALQFDHVNGGGRRLSGNFVNHRAYLKSIRDNKDGMFQLLCSNCNWIKRFENKEFNRRYTKEEERLAMLAAMNHLSDDNGENNPNTWDRPDLDNPPPVPVEKCGRMNRNAGYSTCVKPKGHLGKHEDSTKCWWN